VNIIFKTFAQIPTIMRNICTISLILFLALGKVFSQAPTVFVSPKTATVAVGQTINIDVSVRNFTSLLSISFEAEWDKTVLEFVSVTNITTALPGFNAASNLGNTIQNTSNGKMPLLWLDNTLTPLTLQGETRLFTLTLKGLKDGASPISIKKGNVITADEREIPPIVENGTVTSGNGGTGGGSNTNPLVVTLGNVTGQAGQQVCVPITVSNFSNMQGLQFGISYNTTLLQSPSIKNINLPDLTTGSFGLPPAIPAGNVRMSWSDASSNSPKTVPDNTKIFDLCFNVAANATPGTTPVSIASTVMAIEATRANVGSVNVQVTNSLVTIQSAGGNANEFRLTAASTSAATNATVCLDITANGFSNILTLQHSINWNQNLLRFKEIKLGANPINLQLASNFGVNSTTNGRLSFSWEGANATAVTIPNNSVLYQLCFDVLGSAGQSAQVQFTSTPTPAEVSNGSGRVVPFNSTPGTVTISGGGGGTSEFRISLPTVSVERGQNICLDVKVTSFKDIIGLQHSFKWNAALLRFKEAKPVGSNLLRIANSLGTNAAEASNGILRFSWDDPQLAGVTIPDETVVYQLCFDVIGGGGQAATIEFANSPVEREVINKASQKIPFNSTSGIVNITGGGTQTGTCDLTAFPICISKETVQQGQSACVSVTAQDFQNIIGLQFSILFDRSFLQYTDIQIANTPLALTLVSGTSAGNINKNDALSAGVIVFTWNDPTLAGVSIADDTELFKICFNTIKEGTGSITFQNTPTAFEVTDKNFNLIPFKGSNGSVTITAACSAPVVDGLITNLKCAGQTNGAIDVSVTGGNGTYTYNWGQGQPTTQDLSNLGAGTYTVTVTSGGSCGATNKTFTITQPTSALTAQAQVNTNVQCFGQNTGAITVTASGGTGTYTYNWSPNQLQGTSPTNLPAGSYAVTVTDQNGCQTTVNNLTVTGPTQALAVKVEKTDTKCAGENNGVIRLTASGGTGIYTYRWASPLTGTNATQNNLSAGTYAATVTDANGCQANTNIVIEGGGSPISVTDTVINRITNNVGSITITVAGGSGDYTYDWKGPEGFTRITKDANNISTPGQYTLKITDSNGCSVSETYVISVPMTLATSRLKPSCSGVNDGAIEIEIQGGIPPYQYLWSNGVENKSINNLALGNYTPTITDASGDTFTPDPFVITVSPAIAVAANTQPETCSDLRNDGSITITPSGGIAPLKWQWETPGFDNLATRSNLNRGNYVYTITDAIGCVKSDTIRVAYVPSAPELSNFEIKNVTCSGLSDGRIAFDVSCGDPNYVVSLQRVGDTTILKYTYNTPNPRFEATGLASGTYKVSVTESNDNITNDEISIAAPEIFNVAATISSSTEIFAPCNGQIRLNVTGGSGNYTYKWNNNSTSSTITSACAGRYTVTVTDVKGCQRVDTIQLTNLNANGVVNNTNCPSNDPSGSIILNVQSGQPPYSFEWRNARGEVVGNNTQNLMNAVAGSYTVKITEESGVSVTRTFEITSNSDLNVSARFGANYNGFGVSCKGAEDAILMAEGKNSQTYSYRWQQADSTLSTTDKLEGVGVGNYKVFVTDDEGCTSSTNIVVVEPPALSVTKEVLNILCAGDRTGEVMLVPTGGASKEYTFKWSHDPTYTFGTAAGLSSGAYVITISDKNNCSIVDSLIITTPDPLIVEIDNTPFSVDISGSVKASATGGTGAYNYTWIDEDSGKVVSTESSIEKIKSEISLILIVEDENACRDSLNTDVFNLNECLTNRSVITPNGDGKNETFEIKCVEFYSQTHIEIFNYWGQLVFISDNYDIAWNGRDMDGNLLPDGPYFYVLQFVDIDDKMKEVKGTVTILTE
jgi:gliding motility-associated-like protein